MSTDEILPSITKHSVLRVRELSMIFLRKFRREGTHTNIIIMDSRFSHY